MGQNNKMRSVSRSNSMVPSSRNATLIAIARNCGRNTSCVSYPKRSLHLKSCELIRIMDQDTIVN